MNFPLNSLLSSFIPLFVAIDILGIVPVFPSITEEMIRLKGGRQSCGFVYGGNFSDGDPGRTVGNGQGYVSEKMIH